MHTVKRDESGPQRDRAGRSRWLAGLVLVLAGCAVVERSSVAADAPPELRRLEMLVGTWEGRAASTVVAENEVFESLATTEVRWDAGGRFLLERTRSVVDGQDTITTVGVWTWEPSSGQYRNWRFSSLGTSEVGFITYDESTRTWFIESQTVDLTTGLETHGSGVMRYLDDDEKVYTWKGYSADGEPLFEAHGRSHRLAP